MNSMRTHILSVDVSTQHEVRSMNSGINLHGFESRLQHFSCGALSKLVNLFGPRFHQLENRDGGSYFIGSCRVHEINASKLAPV